MSPDDPKKLDELNSPGELLETESAVFDEEAAGGEEVVSGVLFGPYKVLSHLVSGGTGEFWLTIKKDSSDGQIFVAKTLQSRVGMDHPFIEEFWRKARLAAGLIHPGVTQILDGGESNGVHYVIMEYVPGQSLEKILTERPVPPLWFTLKVGIQICEALHYAHFRNGSDASTSPMIHQCLSPKKIMLSSSGQVKVLGFGIAQVASQIQDIPSRVRMSRFTYFSPEHLRGTPLDPRSDVYGIGVLLYMMLSGNSPFTGNSVFHLIQRISEGNPKSITPNNSEVSPELEQIVFKAMHHRIDKRYQSAGELKDDLEGVLAGLQQRPAALELPQYLRTLFPEIPWGTGKTGQVTESLQPEPAFGSEIIPGKDLAIDPLSEEDWEIITVDHDHSKKNEPISDPSLEVLDDQPDSEPTVQYAFSHESAAIFFEQGLANVRNGNFSTALKQWNKATELDPENRSYKANIQRLKQLIDKE